MKRAFTLIELLVVIAIIAILAAILFPVFAQAKEAAKKTAALSNAKQAGTSVQLYLNDNDDMYPRATPYMEYSGGYLTGIVFPFPYDSNVSGVYTSPDYLPVWAETYPNSVQPYSKSNDISTQGPTLVTIQGFPLKANAGRFGLTLNGLLQNLSGSIIQSPSSAVMFWGGFGDANYNGFACNNPQVSGCGSEGTCTFPNDGYGEVYQVNPAWNSTTTPWTYTKGVAVVRADTSAKWRKIALQVNKNNKGPFNMDVWNDPFSAVYQDKNGWHGQINLCNKADGTGYDASSSAQRWPCFFRPDRAQ